MFKDSEIIKLEAEVERLRREYANLTTQDNAKKEQIDGLRQRLEELVNKLVKVGNSCFTSIFNTLDPILEKQSKNAKISDSAYGQGVLNSLQMAMQVAYTAEEKMEQIRLQELELDQKRRELEAQVDMHTKEMQIKQLELDQKRRELEAEIKFKEAQIAQILESIRDNRYIKALEHTSEIIGMALSANAAVPQGMYALYFGLVNTLVGLNFSGPEGTGK